MNRTFTILILLFLFTSIYSSAQVNCGTDESEIFLQSNPSVLKSYMNSVSVHTSSAKQVSSNTISTVSDTLPVVVHIIQNSPNVIVSDATIQSMIDDLNIRFAKLNADTSTVPAPFMTVSSSVPYRFCLAKRDPNGMSTNGIVRITSTHPQFTFSTFHETSQSALGGDDFWDINRYCNIYVTDATQGVSRRGASWVHIMLAYNSLGSLTHEMGHAFDLMHTWGLNVGCTTDDDGFSDTPFAEGPAYVCNFPLYDACTTTGNGVMYSNFMDYACKTIFTQEQCQHMIAHFTSDFAGTLGVSNACIEVVAIDAGCLIVPGTVNNCTNIISPKVIIKNRGLNPLTSANISYKIDNGTATTVPWTGNLQHWENDTITLSPVTLVGIPHSLKVYAENPNVSVDMDHTNDTAFLAFNLLPSATSIPFTEDFEDPQFLNHGWAILNPNNDSAFHRTTTVAHTGSACIMYSSVAPNAWGHTDAITLNMDLTGIAHPMLSFYEAYAYRVDWTAADKLSIYVSNDGGGSYNLVKFIWGDNYQVDSLETVPPINDTTLSYVFVPSATEWKQWVVDLNGFTSGNCVLLHLEMKHGLGGFQLYMDDINIIDSNSIGVNEIQKPDNIKLFPNPATASLNLSFPQSLITSEAKIEIFDIAGKNIRTYQRMLEMNTSVDISGLQNGMYFIRISSSNFNAEKKFIVH